MVFCYQNCSDLQWEKIVLVIEKNFPGWRPRISKIFEITRTIHSNSEGSEQFLITEWLGFSDVINKNNYNSNWKKPLGFRNLLEKLEKDEYLYKMALNPRTRIIFLHKFFTGKKENCFQEQVTPSQSGFDLRKEIDLWFLL